MQHQPVTLNESVKEAIALALFHLLKTKTITQISISEIVTLAGVSRSSFYRNYDTKEQILCDYIHQCYRNYFMNKPKKMNQVSDFNTFLYHRFRFIRLHKDFFIILRKHNLLYYLFETLDPELSIVLSGMELESEYTQVFFSSCSAGIIRQWIDNDFKETEEEMVKILTNISLLLKSA